MTKISLITSKIKNMIDNAVLSAIVLTLSTSGVFVVITHMLGSEPICAYGLIISAIPSFFITIMTVIKNEEEITKCIFWIGLYILSIIIVIFELYLLSLTSSFWIGVAIMFVYGTTLWLISLAVVHFGIKVIDKHFPNFNIF